MLTPEQQLFDPEPGNYEPYVPPEPAESEAPPVQSAELSYYAKNGVSSDDEAEIYRQLEFGQRSRDQIEKDVLGHVVRQEKPQLPIRPTNHHPGRPMEKTRVLRRPRGSRGLDTADSDKRVEAQRALESRPLPPREN